MAKSRFTTEVIEVIRSIPQGKVATYGGIARLAGNPRAARQVARILHACAEKEALPWHRVINREGRISLKSPHGCEEQRELLEQEGVIFDAEDQIELTRFEWQPDDEWGQELDSNDFEDFELP